jgi:hypothetical protein
LCGRPGAGLADAGSGLIGWRHLAPVCGGCLAGQPTLTLADFTARLDGPVRVASLLSATSLTGNGRNQAGQGRPAERDLVLSRAAESPIAVLTAEIALLHARLDDLQSRLDK